jgi:2-polyprenyl-6-methoxyphenol hydroxylase-like FAD-dependent oxidoreductase
MSLSSQNNSHAIVIGASLGGLLTARVLSNHFNKVTILEKDEVTNDAKARKGQPHTQHLHGLLPAGLNVMLHYFPDLLHELEAAGANIVDFAKNMRWFTHGGYRKTFEIGLPAVSASRPLLEQIVRQKVIQMTGIELKDNITVKKLITSASKKEVIGVEAEQKNNQQIILLKSNLVVDVSGRGSKTFQWLNEMGYQAPETSEVKVNLGYATRLFERNTKSIKADKWFFNTPEAPHEYKSGGAFPIDGNRWIVTMAGWHGEHPQLDEEKFNAYAMGLPQQDIYEIIQSCKPVSSIVQYKYMSSLRKHYEKLTRFPQQYLVLGDAFCSFNPVYGQGMTSAALQVKLLDEILHIKAGANKLAKAFFKQASKIIDIPWNMAVGEDFRYPETTGPKPIGIGIINRYIYKVHKATLKDEIVCKAFLEVMSLLKPPASLFHPKILLRVMKY